MDEPNDFRPELRAILEQVQERVRLLSAGAVIRGEVEADESEAEVHALLDRALALVAPDAEAAGLTAEEVELLERIEAGTGQFSFTILMSLEEKGLVVPEDGWPMLTEAGEAALREARGDGGDA